MFKKISWMALIIGLAAKVGVSAGFGFVFYFFLGKFMLMMGTPSFFLTETYGNSPIGLFCGAIAATAGSVALGFAIGKFLKVKTRALLNIIVFILLEGLVFFLASGLNVPGYQHVSISFIEIVSYLFTVGAFFLGGLLVTYRE